MIFAKIQKSQSPQRNWLFLTNENDLLIRLYRCLIDKYGDLIFSRNVEHRIWILFNIIDPQPFQISFIVLQRTSNNLVCCSNSLSPDLISLSVKFCSFQVSPGFFSFYFFRVLTFQECCFSFIFASNKFCSRP